MNDLGMYETLAAALLRQYGKDARRIRRSIAEQEKARSLLDKPEHRAGIDLVIEKLKARLAECDPTPEAERGP